MCSSLPLVFLLSYIPAAFVIGLIAGKSALRRRIALACAAGLAVIYLVGLPYMGLILNVYLGKDMGVAAILWADAALLPWDVVENRGNRGAGGGLGAADERNEMNWRSAGQADENVLHKLRSTFLSFYSSV